MPPDDERLSALIAHGQRLLQSAGIEDPRRESRRLLAHALGVDAAGLLDRDHVDAGGREIFGGLVRRRMAHEPFAYITGRQSFWTLDLAVSGQTLIPRADSETVIEALLALRPDRGRDLRILDLGTGTGCLLLAALSEYAQATGLGVDLSEAACRVAVANARHNHLAARTMMLCGRWGDALGPRSGCRFDVVLSNPPYIRHDDVAGLMPEVARHEPHLALDGGPDGLDAYRAILPGLGHLLAPGGVVLLEVGRGQDQALAGLAAAVGLRLIGTRCDLGGIVRVVCLGLG